jgi:U4/U6.U5 tri-snRNP component SNU23
MSYHSQKQEKLDGHSTKRRVWDRDEYREKAKDREFTSTAKIEPPKLSPGERRKELEARESKLNFEDMIGKTVSHGGKGALPKDLGFYCKICQCSMKDSANYTDHLNGEKHQRMLGMSMKVKQSTIKEVRARIKENKRKLESPEATMNAAQKFDRSVALSREDEEERRKKRKLQKKEEKEEQRKSEAEVQPDWEDDEEKQMAAMLGIPMSFGGSKKPK